jgi:outer membrane receptor protein involved in Fe transport
MTLSFRLRPLAAILAVSALIGLTPRAVHASSVTAQETIRGRVIDESGNPVAGATVLISELTLLTHAASDGTFSFPSVPAGQWVITARHPGYTADVRVVDVRGAMDLTFRLALTPFRVEPLTITATRLPTDPLRSPLPVSALSEDQLRREQSIALAKSLSKLPGVRSVSTGEQIGKPMIRGLFGSRVLVLENGSRLEDYSWSDEDAPSVDARLAQRVEVIRGPASVLYGSDAVGGVVNVIPEDLPSTNGGPGFNRYGIELYGASNNKEFGSALKYTGARGKLGWRIFGVGRFAEAYSTPDGEVENTGFLSGAAEAALGIHGARSNTTLRFSHYGGEFKLLEAGGPPPGTVEGQEEGPERKLVDDRLQLSNDYLFGAFRLETKAQYQRHALQEVSDDACRLFPDIPSCAALVATVGAAAAPKEQPAFDLLLNTGTLDLLGHHVLGDRVRGTLGVSGIYQTNDSRGPIFLVPDATTSSIGAFLFEDLTYGQWSFLAGGRVDSRKVDADANAALGMNSDKSRTWTVSSGNVGAVFRPIPIVALAGNFGAAWRAPTLFELYSNGPLLAEGRYEIGDENLDAERALNLDGSIRWEAARVRGEIAAFRNKISDFIYLAPTSQTINGLQVFRHLQADALLTGGEVSAEVELVPQVTIRGRHDFVRGTNEDTDEPLPLMAPRRTAGGIDFRITPTWANSFFAGGEVEHVGRQNRPNQFDYVTDSYTLVNFDVGIEKDFRGSPLRLEIGVRNAGDVRYKNFMSRYKEFALEPGRNIIVRISTER